MGFVENSKLLNCFFFFVLLKKGREKKFGDV